MNTDQRMMLGERKKSDEIFKSEILGKSVTNFEITRDSILEIAREKYNLEDLDIEIFLDKLSEETLEVILEDISPDYIKCRCNND